MNRAARQPSKPQLLVNSFQFIVITPRQVKAALSLVLALSLSLTSISAGLAHTGDGAASPAGSLGTHETGLLTQAGLSASPQMRNTRVAALPLAVTFVSGLVSTTDLSLWSPPSPDPSGIVYIPGANTLLVSDAEVEEMPIYAGANLYTATLSGALLETGTTQATSLTNEPTGLAYNPTNGDLFISDDDQKQIDVVQAGTDGKFGTADDVLVSQINTLAFNGVDPEGVTFDHNGQGVLYIADGINSEVYIVTPGSNGLFDGVDDTVTSFDTFRLGLRDPEGISLNTDTGHLYIIGKPADTVFEVSTSGNLVQLIDISAANGLNIAGLTYAPGSLNPAQMNIYIVDRRVDNNTNPNENDGMMYEMTLPLPPAGPVPPEAAADSALIIQGTQVTIDVAANDSDLNGNLDPSSANTACGTGCASPANGSLVNNGDGTFTYTPAPGFTGPDSFTYQICDTDSQCSTAKASIIVSGEQTLYVSSTTGGNVGGVAFSDEDILAYDISSGTWSMYFDGSDVGLVTTNQNLDAFHINADGSILFSLSLEDTLPDVGFVDDSDILRFVPTSTGENTAGSFEWYFDGSDVELEANGEDIDAIGFAPDGRLLISTFDIHSVTGIPFVPGADEDLLAFTATSLGETTAGTWELYFEGSDVGLNTTTAEDVNGAWVDSANGNIFLTTLGAFEVTGAAGEGTDIFVCVPISLGPVTSCTFSLAWDGSLYGFGSEILDGFAFASLGPDNQAPLVDAGPDQIVTLPDFATLDGTVTDDGLPNPPAAVTTAWSQISGAGTATFGDASAVDTTASFSDAGTYVLRLTADDGYLSAFDEVTITVNPPANQAPGVNAGTDQTVTLPDTATLDGTVTDDGLPNPPGTVTTLWSQISGAGSVTFGNSSAVDTTASFSAAGTYVLRLTANDGGLSAFDEVTVTVNPAVGNTVFDLGAAGNYAVLGLSNAVVTMKDDFPVINGDVGLGPNGERELEQGYIAGTFYMDPTASTKALKISIQGGTVIQNMAQAVADALRVSSDASNLAATRTFGDIKSTMTINASGNLTVVDVNKIELKDGNILTLRGGSTDVFVINIADYLKLENGSKIRLDGGLQTSNVLFNFEKRDAKAEIKSGSTAYGIFLATGRDAELKVEDRGASVVGALIAGKKIEVKKDAQVSFFNPASGNTVTDLGAAGNYAVFGLANALIVMQDDNPSITGDVGLGPNGERELKKGSILGTFYMDPTAKTKELKISIQGGTVIQNMAQAVADALRVSSDASNFAATQTFGDIKSSMTINTSGNLTVVDVNKIELKDGKTLTLSGGSADVFVINIADSLKLENGSKIRLAGGLRPDNVLFNFEKRDAKGEIKSGSTAYGIFLATGWDAELKVEDRGSSVTGILIAGKKIEVMKDAQVNFLSP